jgi:hypothetical protein
MMAFKRFKKNKAGYPEGKSVAEFKPRFVLPSHVMIEDSGKCISFVKLSFLEDVADDPSRDHVKEIDVMMFPDLTWEEVITNSTSRKEDYCQLLQITQEDKPQLLDAGLDHSSLTPKQRRGFEIYRKTFIEDMNLGPDTKAAEPLWSSREMTHVSFL